jgi:hypothetical protein
LSVAYPAQFFSSTAAKVSPIEYLYPAGSVIDSMPKSSVTVVLTAEEIENSDPTELLEARVLRELAVRYGFREDELEFIRASPTLRESCRVQVMKARRASTGGFFRKGRDSVSLSVDFDRPGTRSRSNREVVS